MDEAKEILIKLDTKTVAALKSAMAVRAKVWAEAARAVSAEANQVFLQANDVYLKAVDEANAIYYKTVDDDVSGDVSAEANEVLCQAIDKARAVRDNACPDDPRVIFEKAEDEARAKRLASSVSGFRGMVAAAADPEITARAAFERFGLATMGMQAYAKMNTAERADAFAAFEKEWNTMDKVARVDACAIFAKAWAEGKKIKW